MKKETVFILLLLSMALPKVNAQEFLPMFEEGKTVHTVYFEPDQENGTTFILEVKGDSTINGHTCAKIWSSSYNSMLGDYSKEKVLDWLAYEEESKLYVKKVGTWTFRNNEEFCLFFDYNWQKGDTVKLETFFYPSNSGKFDNAYAVIDDVTEITSPCGKTLRQWNFTAYAPWNPLEGWEGNIKATSFKFIEGIGLINHDGFDYGFFSTGYYGSQSLWCTTGKGEILLDAGRGPVWTGISNIEDKPSAKIYHDISGRKLSGKPTHGVYLLNGEKYISR